MLKEFASYLVSLGKAQGIVTTEINGDTYVSTSVNRVAPHVDRPEKITVNGLDSIAKMVSHELDMVENQPIYFRGHAG